MASTAAMATMTPLLRPPGEPSGFSCRETGLDGLLELEFLLVLGRAGSAAVAGVGNGLWLVGVDGTGTGGGAAAGGDAGAGDSGGCVLGGESEGVGGADGGGDVGGGETGVGLGGGATV